MAGTAGSMKQASLGLGLVLALLSACGEGGVPGKGAAARDAGAPSRQREGALEVLAVAGTLPARSAAVRDFEAASACKLRIRTARDSAELLALATQADADLVLARGDIAASLVASGRVRAIAPAKLPALASVDSRLAALPGALIEGRRYGVPWRWQPVVLAYDSQALPTPPASWSLLYAPPGDAAPRVLASPEPLAIADAALFLASARPELGIGDPYALDARQYAAALSLLRTQAAATRGTARDLAAQAEGFRNGVVASAATPAQVRALQAAALPVAWTLPDEGGSAQVELGMLHSAAKHPNCAQFWLEWSLSPPAQARLAAETGALPAVAAACALEPLAGTDACARDGMALLPQLQLQRVPATRCGRTACVPYSRWTRDYLALFDAR